MRCWAARDGTQPEFLRRAAVRGIILAGAGDYVTDATDATDVTDATNRQPATPALPKSLLAVRGQPVIYHSLSLLLLAGIRHILIVATPRAAPLFQQRLGGGEAWGINLSYAIQPATGDPVQALIIASEFTGGQSLALAPGDQIFHGRSLPATLQKAATLKKGARIFARPADPADPGTGYAVTGLAFYDNTVAERARELMSSQPGPAITDLNNAYLAEGALEVEILGDEITWLNINSRDSLRAAAGFLAAAEKDQGVKAGCPEEAAWRMGFIGDEALLKLAAGLGAGCYGRYLRQLIPATNPGYNTLTK